MNYSEIIPFTQRHLAYVVISTDRPWYLPNEMSQTKIAYATGFR